MLEALIAGTAIETPTVDTILWDMWLAADNGVLIDKAASPKTGVIAGNSEFTTEAGLGPTFNARYNPTQGLHHRTIQYAADLNLAEDTKWTLYCEFKFKTLPNLNSNIWSDTLLLFGQVGTNTGGWSMVVNQVGNVGFMIAGNLVINSNSPALNEDTPHKVVMTRDGTDLYIYINGVLNRRYQNIPAMTRRTYSFMSGLSSDASKIKGDLWFGSIRLKRNLSYHPVV